MQLALCHLSLACDPKQSRVYACVAASPGRQLQGGGGQQNTHILTAELRGFVAVVQAVVVPVTLPALLDAAVVLTRKLPLLALRGRDVGRVGWTDGQRERERESK